MSTNIKPNHRTGAHRGVCGTTDRLVSQVCHASQGSLVPCACPVREARHRLVRYVPDTKVSISIVRLVGREKVVRDRRRRVRKVEVDVLTTTKSDLEGAEREDRERTDSFSFACQSTNLLLRAGIDR
jgi:hypothetical protein